MMPARWMCKSADRWPRRAGGFGVISDTGAGKWKNRDRADGVTFVYFPGGSYRNPGREGASEGARSICVFAYHGSAQVMQKRRIRKGKVSIALLLWRRVRWAPSWCALGVGVCKLTVDGHGTWAGWDRRRRMDIVAEPQEQSICCAPNLEAVQGTEVLAVTGRDANLRLFLKVGRTYKETRDGKACCAGCRTMAKPK